MSVVGCSSLGHFVFAVRGLHCPYIHVLVLQWRELIPHSDAVCQLAEYDIKGFPGDVIANYTLGV